MGGSDDEDQVTTTNPWAPAAGKGQDIIDLAEQLFNQQGGLQGNWIDFQGPGINQNMIGAWDAMAESGALNAAAGKLTGLGDQLTGQLGSALDSLKRGSQAITTYDVQSTRDTYLKDKESYLTNNDAAIQAQLQKSIAGSTGQIYGVSAGMGNVGSSRTQLAIGQAAGDLASNAQSMMAQQRSQAYDQAMAQANSQLQFDRQQQLNAAQQGFSAVQQGANMYQVGAGLYQQAIGNQLSAGLQQYNTAMQQAQINYQNMLGQQNAGWQNLGLYNGVVAGWAGAGGTSTITGAAGGGGSNPLGAIGSIAGGVIGGIYGGGPAGAAAGASIGGAAGNALSDVRLKTDIRRVGTNDKLGLGIYTWEWNDTAKRDIPEYKLDYNKGYIAQEVMRKYPDFIGEYEGYLVVKYDDLRKLEEEII